jgi:hypothetical protein
MLNSYAEVRAHLLANKTFRSLDEVADALKTILVELDERERKLQAELRRIKADLP